MAPASANPHISSSAKRFIKSSRLTWVLYTTLPFAATPNEDGGIVKSDNLEIARFLHLKSEIKKSQIGRSA
jgi:hypothetical protein